MVGPVRDVEPKWRCVNEGVWRVAPGERVWLGEEAPNERPPERLWLPLNELPPGRIAPDEMLLPL